MEGEERPTVAVASGVGQLQANNQIIIGTERKPMSPAALVQQALEIRRGLLVEKQLPRVSPRFFKNGRRFAPDEFGTAGTETLVTPECQFIRPAIQRAVAAFHRLNAQRVACAQESQR